MHIANRKSFKLLLVDDEEDIREVLRFPLADLGYDVLMAENAVTALSVFNKEHPDIVLTDIKMPDMDGIELLQRIKNESPDAEVIMITGHGDMNLAIRSLKHEATDFITKPINVDALEIALGRAETRIQTRLKLKEYTENLEALIREKTELKDHLSSLGLLIGSVSHGIKGVLTRLDGGLYLLDAGIRNNQKGQVAEGRDMLKHASARIRKMVQDVLYYAKKRPLELETTNSVDFAKEVSDAVMPRIKTAGIDFFLETEQAPKRITMDQERMRSALLNILDNAVDACEKVEFPHGPRHIVFCIEKLKKQVIFKITDNGIGMDRETRQNILRLFFSKKGRRGTGLGLFITNQIVQQHNGDIKIESRPGKGSTFILRIPQ
jgi:signal transduction histidine kinase